MKSQTGLRPTDLAREHGLSTQAVRNYEQIGCIPPAARTASGYRIYTEVHAAALRAYLALVPAYGYTTAKAIMSAFVAGDTDRALLVIDRGHGQLLGDRETLDSVRRTVRNLTAEADQVPADPGPRSIGELAHRLRVTPATLRNWEEAGILAPARDRGHRRYEAADIRDADLAHLLRRGGYPLAHIATVIHQVRTAGGTAALATALDDWQAKLTTRGLAMLTAAARVESYLSTVDVRAAGRPPAASP